MSSLGSIQENSGRRLEGNVYGFCDGRNGFLADTELPTEATIEICVERFPELKKGSACKICIEYYSADLKLETLLNGHSSFLGN